MTSRPKLLALLALPAGAVGYFVTAAILQALPLPSGLAGLLLLIGPLFVAGLCMLPFVLPLIDQTAKRDLAAHRAEQAVAPGDDADADTPTT